MTLPPGTRLGPYEIIAPLGAGGMGEVYRANDTRLDRVVAVKVLATHFSSNPEMKQRFEREARAVSSLSHSNICTLHDIGHENGIDYLVMEFIEGESLSDRLERGPLPLEQVFRYAIQIADALEGAHRQGIVHRDLKPGNIMLAKSGAKLLDFGLAKLLETGSGGGVPGLSHLPTERQSLTGEGTILGTFQYMAPEQLEGQSADTRTDIFAFGSVVYEMATGKRAFNGKSQASLIGAILKDDPPAISAIQPMTPPALDRVVKTCLAKDPDDRWQTAHDLAQELKWIAEGGSEPGLRPVASSRPKTRERVAWIVAAVLFLVASILGLFHAFRSAPSEPHVIRFYVPPPEQTMYAESLAVSPDGRMLAFTARHSDGNKRLWIRPLDGLESKVLPGTDGAEFPFWSPDSRFIGFFANNKLKKVDISGAPPQVLCDANTGARGGAWNRDGTIIFSPDFTTPLYRVSSDGGAPIPVTKFDDSRKENSHRWPCFLPDGRRFLYYSRTVGAVEEAVFVGSLDSDLRQFLFASESGALLVPANSQLGGTPYLLFIRNNALMAQRFDDDKMRLSGEAHRIADEVVLYGESGPTAYGAFSISADGVLAYRTGGSTDVKFEWVDRENKERVLVRVPAGSYSEPSLSPDEKRVAFARADPQSRASDIWLLDLSRNTPTRFTFAATQENCPLWSPDGKRIVFTSDRNGKRHLYQKDASETGSEDLLVDNADAVFADHWSLDGRYLLFETKSDDTTFDLWVLPMFGERKPYPFLQSEFNETHAQFSPDGRWVAYVSDETGQAEVYVRSFDGSGGKWQISNGGGDQPTWRRDGKEMFYLSPERQLMSVSINARTNFEAGIPVPLFEVVVPPSPLTGDRNHYVVAQNGQKFLVCSLGDKERARPITVVSNWMSALKEKR